MDFLTYDGKGVPGLIEEKMEPGLKNIDKWLVHDKHKVRIYNEYFLPTVTFANCYIFYQLLHFLNSWSP
jgi:hypothetical protein